MTEQNEQKSSQTTPLGAYHAEEIENRLYQWWMDQGFFEATGDQKKKPFTIVMPPPNVTGVLHLGHALDNTIQDLLIRMRRMQGYDALWLPGTDHAGIATQTRVEAQLSKNDGLSRHDIGREEFVKRVWEWKEQYAEVIRSQIRRLGASCDWSRERFTMDPGLSKAVREVFVTFYEKGLIYRGNYIINWCPRCGTALSDIEVEYEETKGTLYHITYPFTDGSGSLVIATTRPETLFGDVAVAVHPDDDRYRSVVGKYLRLPFVEREIPVIADEYVDPEFGTGAVKITPAHDPNDFEVGQRHHLQAMNVMTKDGKLNEYAGKFATLDRYEARTQVVAELMEQGLLTHEEHDHSVGHCERCGTVVEPWLSTQWFVKMEPLAIPAKEVVASGETQFIPDRFAKIYSHWLEHIRDWCISRQLWWGHRIPAFYCANCGGTTVSRDDVHVCSHCGSHQISQDEDVLDTWFSSALWPFSTMGWPDDETGDLARYFPTQVLSTGFDIIYFWVARMIFMSLSFTGIPPFEHVLMHGLVRDDQGRKFSKSLGNGIDPMDVIEKYSADALRFMLVTGATLGQDMRFYLERVESAQALVTKIWNASRFVLMNIDSESKPQLPTVADRSLADRYILHRLQETSEQVTQELESYQFAEAGKTIYEFIWNDFCDWYIELAKVSLYDEQNEQKAATQGTLVFVLDHALRLLHPFMPFVTEEIWRALPHDGETIMRASWPDGSEALVDYKAFTDMMMVMDVVRAVRALRHEKNIAPSKKIDMILRPKADRVEMLQVAAPYLVRLCNPQSLLIAQDVQLPEERITSVLADVEIIVSLEGLVDLAAEQKRLTEEKKQLEFEVSRLQGKLNNESFVAKAPDAIVQKEREKLQGYMEQLEKIVAELERIVAVSNTQPTE
ncbi:MAG: valine--tRNA ligase [Acidibacillus sp.]|nr:valine--tRNA ligase [Acidibacillus sp.]